MDRHLQSYGKENYYERHRTPQNHSNNKLSFDQASSNQALLRKFEGNITPVRGSSPVERAGLSQIDSQLPSFQGGQGREEKEKRGSARQRDFEMRVNNISAINGRIEELLSFVKKDRKEQRFRREKTVQRDLPQRQTLPLKEADQGGEKSAKEIGTSMKKIRRDGSFIQRSLSPLPTWAHDFNDKPEQPRISTFQDHPQPAFNRPSREDSFHYKQQRSFSRSPAPVRHEVSQGYNLKNLRTKYMPEDRDRSCPRRSTKQYLRDKQQQKSAGKEKKQWKYNIDTKTPQVRSSYERYLNRSVDHGVEAMLSERRKRSSLLQVDRTIIEESMVSEVQARDSPESSRHLKSIQINQQPQKYYPKPQPSPSRKRSIPKSRHSESWHAPLESIPESRVNHLPVVTLDESSYQRNSKITATTKLLDEQIYRIKNKIQNSEKNTHMMQMKLGSSVKEGDHSNNGREESTRIALQLSKQVQIDSRLREAREHFQKLPGEEKWEELQSALQLQGINYSQSQLEGFIKLAADQHNPFGSSTSGITPAQVADLLVQAQSHWKDKVRYCSRSSYLSAQGFQVSQLDLGRKGYLSTEDMVCFINLYSGSFYRNRDVSLIMRRLQSKPNHIDYSTLMSTMSR